MRLRNVSLTSQFYWIIMLLLVLCETAHAYIDFGTGSMFVQVLIAALAGILYAVKLKWNSLKAIIFRIFRKKSVQIDE